MRGNASVDARIKVLFDTRRMSLPVCAVKVSLPSNNSPCINKNLFDAAMVRASTDDYDCERGCRIAPRFAVIDQKDRRKSYRLANQWKFG